MLKSKRKTKGIMIPHRRWKILPLENAEKVRNLLLEKGGKEEKPTSAYEKWRIRFKNSTFILYTTGTLYSTPSSEKEVEELREEIDQIVGGPWVPPTRDILIGMDEVGKGEILGYIHVIGVYLPSRLFHEISPLLSVTDTKQTHSFPYWEKIFQEIFPFFKKGLYFLEERIHPKEIDEFNINQLLDRAYTRILNKFLRNLKFKATRITIDDYGIGKELGNLLKNLEDKGMEVMVMPKADDHYLEVRIASLLGKIQREKVMKEINERRGYQIMGLSPGSGNTGDKNTMEWLKAWYNSGQQWPWFVRQSFSPVRKIEGKTGKVKKSSLP